MLITFFKSVIINFKNLIQINKKFGQNNIKFEIKKFEAKFEFDKLTKFIFIGYINYFRFDLKFWN